MTFPLRTRKWHGHLTQWGIKISWWVLLEKDAVIGKYVCFQTVKPSTATVRNTSKTAIEKQTTGATKVSQLQNAPQF